MPFLALLVWYIIYRCKLNKLNKADKRKNQIDKITRELKDNQSNYEIGSFNYLVLKKEIRDQISELEKEKENIKEKYNNYNVGFCHWCWFYILLPLGVIFTTIFANIHFEWKVNELEQERESLIYQVKQLETTTYDLTNNKYRENLLQEIKDYNIRVYNATYCKNDFIFGIFYDVNYSYVSQIDYGELK